MSALHGIRVGLVVERRKAISPWIDFVWQPVALLPDAPDLMPWTELAREGDAVQFYAGSAVIELYRSETANYLGNLDSGTPKAWVALRPTESEPPYAILLVTLDPSEGEALTEPGTDLVEPVGMPEWIQDELAGFVAQHHVERAFYKRKNKKADPEALGQRGIVREPKA